jgi:hypothetical protein
MCKQVSVSLPYRGDSHDDGHDDYARAAGQLLANYEKPEDLTGADGLFKQLKKALIERALGAELSDHLGYEKGDPAGRGSGSGNSHNGGDRPGLAPRLGTRRAVLRVRSWRPQDDLHHQRGRGAAP